MPKKVKFFESNNIFNLETQVNEFLSEIDHYNIIDIAFHNISSGLPNNHEDDWNLIYTAMVIYIPNISSKGLFESNIPEPIFKNADGTVPEGLTGELRGGPMIVETGKGEGV